MIVIAHYRAIPEHVDTIRGRLPIQVKPDGSSDVVVVVDCGGSDGHPRLGAARDGDTVLSPGRRGRSGMTTALWIVKAEYLRGFDNPSKPNGDEPVTHATMLSITSSGSNSSTFIATVQAPSEDQAIQDGRW